MKTLKYFSKIVLGQRITVYTDNKNIMYDNFTMETVLLWKLLLEEYGSNIKYTKGPDHDAEYALIRFPRIKFYITEREITREN